MEYILMHNSEFDNELYQIDDEQFFEGAAELVMYFDDSVSVSELSKNELLSQEPWTKRPHVPQQPESNINVVLLEQL